MRAVFLIITIINGSTGEIVKEPIQVPFQGVTIDECRAFLDGEKQYDSSVRPVDEPDPVVRDMMTLMHSVRFMEDRLESDGHTKVVITCEEDEVYSPE